MEYRLDTKSVEYIPKWDGNDQADESERCVFTLKYLKNADLAKCYDQRFVDGEAVVETRNDMFIKYGVEAITNLVVNGEEIKTAKDFLNVSGLTGLFTEIAVQIAIMNARIDEGN